MRKNSACEYEYPSVNLYVTGGVYWALRLKCIKKTLLVLSFPHLKKFCIQSQNNR